MNIEPSQPYGGTVTLIDELLAEQHTLTAVEKFSRHHGRHDEPAQARYYRDLIPLAKPRPGEQYAFEVDLDQCSGCKACVTACHGLNGLEDEETWRNVGLLHGGSFLKPIQRTITTACHHCVDPACLNGCPVLAYEKDSVTGIVKHLDDQCIGCQYCVLKCPYDVPKYSERLGIVRKCDLCSSRLASGEAPACVQACPNEAIRITLVDLAATTGAYRDHVGAANPFLPGSPAPGYTVPTTRYRSSEALPETLGAADARELHPQPPHTPLGFMLVLSQLSVGAFTLEQALAVFPESVPVSSLRPVLALAALLIGFLALAISTLHLGRPFGAWRAFLGLRRSWLSREIVAFGLFAGMAALHTAALWFPSLTRAPLPDALGWATLMMGWFGVFSSAMLYHDTRRDFWRLRWSGLKFLGTAVLLGAATALLSAVCAGGLPPLIRMLALIVLLSSAAKLAVEWPIFRRLESEDFSPLHKTALLLEGRLGLAHRGRVACGVIGGILMPACLLLQTAAPADAGHVFSAGGTGDSPVPAGDSPAGTTRIQPYGASARWAGVAPVPSGESPDGTGQWPVLPTQAAAIFLLSLVGELIERRLFFTAVQPVKMPGGVAA